MAKYTLGDLNGPDGNAFAIMSKVDRAMKAENASQEELMNYFVEATSSDYDNLVDISIKKINQLNNPTK